jgi:hypothetical protein
VPTAPRSLQVVSPDAEAASVGRDAPPGQVRRAASLRELWAVLHAEPTPAAPMTLDLTGHSTAGHHLLRLGRTPIDMLDPAVARFFRAMAASGVLRRLRISAVRLLGCETAVTDGGQRTMRMLSRTLGMPVYGTLAPLLAGHHDANGFNPAYAHLLVEASAAEQPAT